MSEETGFPEKLPTRQRLPKVIREALDRAYWTGFEHGEYVGKAAYKDEIRHELELETMNFDPECSLCLAHKKLAETELALARAQLERDDARKKLKGWSIRNGRGYRQTRRLGL